MFFIHLYPSIHPSIYHFMYTSAIDTRFIKGNLELDLTSLTNKSLATA